MINTLLAEESVVCVVQWQVCVNELKTLRRRKDNQAVIDHHTLATTANHNLVLPGGLICFVGRLKYSSECESLKHPGALNGWYLIQDGHAGTSRVLRVIHKFWVAHGGAAFDRVIGNCCRCWKYVATLSEQVMFVSHKDPAMSVSFSVLWNRLLQSTPSEKSLQGRRMIIMSWQYSLNASSIFGSVSFP